MSQGGFVTLVGYVAQDPSLRPTKTGKLVTNVRIGVTPRQQDRVTREWHDAETSYYTVTCWERLAEHVKASLRKGDPVIVKGKFKTNTYEDKTGQPRTVIDIVADTVGHDLSRGVANYMRQQLSQRDREGDPADDEAAENEEIQGLAGGSDAMIDEEAIERFGRDLDADLDQAELAVRALNEGEDEPAGAATPF
jgi:single-strand DNA-binding protein